MEKGAQAPQCCQDLELGAWGPPVAAAPGLAPAPAQEWGQQHHLLSASGTALQRAYAWPSTGFLEGPKQWSPSREQAGAAGTPQYHNLE